MSNFINDAYQDGLSTTINKYFSRYVLAIGIISVILGAIILIWPITTLTAAAYFFGGVLIFVGVGQFIYAFNGHDSTIWKIMYALIGVLSIALGVSAFTNPDPSYALYLLATYVGVVWFMRGFSSLFLAFSLKDTSSEILSFLIGIVGIIAGIGMLASPLFAGLTLSFLVLFAGIMLVITGICEIVGACIKR